MYAYIYTYINIHYTTEIVMELSLPRNFILLVSSDNGSTRTMNAYWDHSFKHND